MYIIPSPKKITELGGAIKNTGVNPTVICDDERLHKAATKLPTSKGGIKLLISASGSEGEGYVLEIKDGKITIEGQSAQGAFYGIQTLRQILVEEEIPCVRIEDEPDFKVRSLYHDITRGRIPTVETLKKHIDMLALYKTNEFQLYSEHVIDFDEFKEITKRTGCITKDEIRELDDYCYENFIDFVPSFATFGHLYEILQTEKYKHLCVLKDYEPIESFWYERVNHHTLDPLNPESFEFIKGRIDQYIPLFRSNKFNICCDETFDLSQGKCEGMDTGKLYVDFVGKIVDYLHSKGKTVLMWEDVAVKHPEHFDNFNKDVIFMPGCYEINVAKSVAPAVDLITSHGHKYYLTSTTRSWCRLIEDIQINEPNICNMVEASFADKAEGLLNTIWGDWGHPCSIDMQTYGIVLGTEKSWSRFAKIDEEYYAKIDKVIYGKKGAVELLKKVSSWASDMFYWQLGKFYSNTVYNGKLQVDLPTDEQIINARDNCLIELEKLKGDTWGNDEYRKELMVSLEGIAVTAEMFAKAKKLPLERKTNTVKWLEKYRAKWLEKNKLGELYEIEKMFMYLDAMPQER